MARSSNAAKKRRAHQRAGKPKPLWKGSVQFGLVNIPVSLYPGEQRSELKFRLLDSRDLSPIRYQRISEKTGREVPWEEIVKGYEYEEDEYVLLSEEELRSVNVEATQTVEIGEFVDPAEIGPIYYERPYYLEPLKNGRKSYALLREVMKRTKRIGIAKLVIRSRQHLAAVMPLGPLIVVDVLRFAHELRDASGLDLPEESPRQLKMSEKEIKMAERLVESMVGKWEPDKYREDFRDDVLKLIEKKIKSGKTRVVEERDAERAPARAKVVDIMDLLKRSVAQAEKEEPRRRKAG